MQTVFLFIIYQMIVDICTNVLTSKKHFGDNFTHFIPLYCSISLIWHIAYNKLGYLSVSHENFVLKSRLTMKQM